jgi:hypothetical protein
LFPRSVRGGQAFDPSRLPRSDEVSAMIVRGLVHVGFDPSLFSCISARRGGLPPRHREGRAGAHPVDAERSRSRRRGASLRSARQPRAPLRHLGGLRPVPYSYSTLRCPEWLACSGRPGFRPSRPGRRPAAAQRVGPARPAGGDVTGGDVTSPPGVPFGPRPNCGERFAYRRSRVACAYGRSPRHPGRGRRLAGGVAPTRRIGVALAGPLHI